MTHHRAAASTNLRLAIARRRTVVVHHCAPVAARWCQAPAFGPLPGTKVDLALAVFNRPLTDASRVRTRREVSHRAWQRGTRCLARSTRDVGLSATPLTDATRPRQGSDPERGSDPSPGPNERFVYCRTSGECACRASTTNPVRSTTARTSSC